MGLGSSSIKEVNRKKMAMNVLLIVLITMHQSSNAYNDQLYLRPKSDCQGAKIPMRFCHKHIVYFDKFSLFKANILSQCYVFKAY
jgi:hypothetical protein